MDEACRAFVEFARGHWPRKAPAGEPVLLMHQIEQYAPIVAYAFFGHALARQSGASLASFGYARSGLPLAQLFDGFGARPILGLRELRPFEAQSRKLAGDLFRRLRTLRDVVNLHVDGVGLGDLIYDSYLRYHTQHTVELRDPLLRDVIAQAIARLFAARQTLDSHDVRTVIVDHAVYMNGGVLARVAIQRGIPVFHLPSRPPTLIQLDPRPFPSLDGAEAGVRTCKPPLAYHRFAEIAARLPLAERPQRLALGREVLEQRFAGQLHSMVLPAGGTAYGEVSDQVVMARRGRPRILVMMHDFCDAPHAYRHLIFEDHYRWICWLFERAGQTSFDWYAKAHPNSALDPARAALNTRVLDELHARFPHIRFVPPSTSNRQLIAEEPAAVFTGYGTVGHEFAYMGLPVVNAGDNPHVTWGFNFNPQTVEELAALVDHAGDLSLPIDRSQIEEHAYLRYIHYVDRGFHSVKMIPPELEAAPDAARRIASSEILRIAADRPADREAEIAAYLEKLEADGRHRLPV